MAKQIAVWGTPDSGKSVLATKLALELTEMGKRVAVVYTDDRAPVLPMLFPGTRAAREYSVGAVLERVLMTPDDVLRQANLCRHHRELALFGYAAGENRQSYPAVLPEKATELYGILSRLADVLIVDCSSALYDSPLSDVAVRTGDKQVPVRFAIIDDMWADVPHLKEIPPEIGFSDMVREMHKSPIRSFEGDPARFPNGMGHTVEALKEAGIRNVGIWFPTTGYWFGVEPGSGMECEFADDLCTAPDGRRIVKPELPHTTHWFGSLCTKAKSWGADFVKIDNQGCQQFYREAGAIGKTARAVQTGIETAIAEVFGGAVINCMGMPSECMFNRPDSAVSRCSDDFMPENREWFTKNILQCAYNGILQGQFYVNDWDMWWTDDGQAEKNSLCRAISGGPIYVSDKLGRTNPEILKPLCLSDGRILRPDESATPTADCLTTDPRTSGKPFKVRNRIGDSGVIAAFNINADNRMVRGTVSPTDAGLPVGDYGYYEQFTGEWGLLHSGESLPVTLVNNDVYRLWRFVPYNAGGVTVLGRLDLFMGVGAVKDVDAEGVTFYEGGKVGFLVDRRDGKKPYFYSSTLPEKKNARVLFSSVIK